MTVGLIGDDAHNDENISNACGDDYDCDNAIINIVRRSQQDPGLQCTE